AKVLTLTALNITGTGTLDLNDNDLILDYAGASPGAAIQSLINSARNGGPFNGTGLTSSFARNNPRRNTTLGLMESRDFKSIFGNAAPVDGQSTDNTALLVKYTYYGDTDLNGTVDFDDFTRADGGFNNRRAGWSNGYFDGSGSLDFDDFTLIDLGFNTQGGVL